MPTRSRLETQSWEMLICMEINQILQLQINQILPRHFNWSRTIDYQYYSQHAETYLRSRSAEFPWYGEALRKIHSSPTPVKAPSEKSSLIKPILSLKQISWLSVRTNQKAYMTQSLTGALNALNATTLNWRKRHSHTLSHSISLFGEEDLHILQTDHKPFVAL